MNNTNEPLDSQEDIHSPQNNEDQLERDFRRELQLAGIGLTLVALFGLSISKCASVAIEKGYLGDRARLQQELDDNLFNDDRAAVTTHFVSK